MHFQSCDLHLLALSVGRVRIARIDLSVPLLRLIHLLDPAGILLRHLSTTRRITDWRQLRAASRRIIGTLGLVRITCRLRLATTIGGACTLVVGFASVLFVLLSLLPFLSDLFEFYYREKGRESANPCGERPPDRVAKMGIRKRLI